MAEPDPKYAAAMDSDSRRTPVRVAFVTRRTSAHVKAEDDALVMTFPEGLFRAAVAIEILLLALVAVSLVWDAPLEALADPMLTPNPAKAPWYFLGLQELLHYFPPVVAGVLIPTMVVIALIVIPYFNINIEAEGMWARNVARRLRATAAAVVGLIAVMLYFDVYVVAIPTALMAAAMLLASRASADSPRAFQRWLFSKPVSFWIMTWFLVEAALLTAIGTFFRGTGWSWVWPGRA